MQFLLCGSDSIQAWNWNYKDYQYICFNILYSIQRVMTNILQLNSSIILLEFQIRS